MRREGQVRIPSGCAIAGIFSRSGERFTGEAVIRAIEIMHDRSNGLGGGFAGYGIYPEHANEYALHLFYDDETARAACESYLDSCYDMAESGIIPTRDTPGVTQAPLIWRYFATPRQDAAQDERAAVVRSMFHINTKIDGAYLFSCGKNMGVFKGVGFPEDIGRFYKLEEYRGYCWTSHGRYPTNTPGWWGGAHPFSMLDYSVVHNGEISSYDANRRSIEPYGYPCTLLTDTEVMSYIVDYLHRVMKLSMEQIARVMAAPFWTEIEDMPARERHECTYLRKRFPGLLVNGPFSILVGFEGGMMALNDRLKLRSMVVGERADRVYVASEESAIRAVAPELDCLYAPEAGQPVIITLSKEARP